jgi:hypothetical protein
MTNTVLSYPIPLYSNVPIRPEFYKPRAYFISAISLGVTTTITTSVDNDYVIGQEIRLIIPPSFGCRQLNEMTGIVISIPSSTQVETNIVSNQNVDNFILSTATTRAQILAIGDYNSGIISSTGFNIPTTNITGSFINIS